MKIGLFTDSHYSSAPLTCGVRHNSRSLRKIREALQFFAAQECELVIILGDLTDTEPEREQEIENVRRIAELLDESELDALCLMGNHDAFVFTEDEFYGLLGRQRRPHTISRDGVNLLFIDACHTKTGEHYAPGGGDWTDTAFPHTRQLAEELAELQGSTYVFMHQNIDPQIREDHRLANDGEIRAILEQSRKVRTVYQGHYHPGHRTEQNGVRYITLPAMCENEGAYWTEILA